MIIKPLHQFSRGQIEQLLAPISFFKAIKQQNLWQFDTLLEHGRFVEYSPGEIVLSKGESDHWIYFLLRGTLEIFNDDLCLGQPLNVVTPGEVYGDLAVLMNCKRIATVKACPKSKEIVAFGLDHNAFGRLHDTEVVNLVSKLAYYRNMVHSLRWKLEVYRSAYPQSPLASEHLKVKLFTGIRDGTDELEALHVQAKSLACLLVAWNEAFGAVPHKKAVG